MSDLLVRLYDLPPLGPIEAALATEGIGLRRALPGDRPVVTALARAHGSEGWAAECDAAFARLPLACFLAVARNATSPRAPETLLGFACYDATCRGFFGPELVHPDRRERGIGRALLVAALHAMRAEGYAYAIIGWASSIEFYQKAVGATVIEGSEPGIYPPALR